jgi:hypothetical protein
MRLLVINTVGDPSTEHIRRRFPGKVFQRPVIGTLPLAPAGRRTLPVEMLKPDVVDQLEYLVSIGNIKVLELGSRMAVSFSDLRRRLGYTTPTQPEVVEPPALETPGTAVPPETPVEPAVSPEEAPTPVLEVEPVAVEPAAVTPDIDAVLAAVEEEAPAPVVDPEPGPGEKFDLPNDIDALLRGVKTKPLIAVLALFGKSGAGKSKAVLVDGVSDVLAGDPDPLLANRAVALLREES